MARAKIIEDNAAPIRMRINALKEISKPPLAMLRRLMVEKPVPVPPRLKALARIRYVQEVERRNIKTGQNRKKPKLANNPLGIV